MGYIEDTEEKAEGWKEGTLFLSKMRLRFANTQ
jgi:hypothetical protein